MAAVMTGRPTKYCPEILTKTIDYIENYEKTYGDAIPMLCGLAIVLGVHKDTLYTWVGEPDKKAFSDLTRKLMNKQEQRLINGGLKNEFNSNLTKLALTKHGYTDRTDIDVNNRTELLRTVRRLDGSEPELIEHAD